MALAARYCSIVVGVLQLLLALLSLWILIDLNATGARINFLALVVFAGLAVTQVCVLVLAWRLRFDSPLRLWSLVTMYSLELAFLGILLALLEVSDGSIALESLILKSGAVLPPNEIMGRDWPLALATASAGAAIAANMFPLASIGAVLLLRRRNTSRRGKRFSEE